MIAWSFMIFTPVRTLPGLIECELSNSSGLFEIFEPILKPIGQRETEKEFATFKEPVEAQGNFFALFSPAMVGKNQYERQIENYSDFVQLGTIIILLGHK